MFSILIAETTCLRSSHPLRILSTNLRQFDLGLVSPNEKGSNIKPDALIRHQLLNFSQVFHFKLLQAFRRELRYGTTKAGIPDDLPPLLGRTQVVAKLFDTL